MYKIIAVSIVLLQVITTAAQSFFFYNMPVTGLDTVYTCYTRFFDSGGRFGNYSNNENAAVTFCPTESGKRIALVLTFAQGTPSFQTANSDDEMRIFNGMDTNSAVVVEWQYTMGDCFAIPSVDTTNGCLTVKFSSGTSVIGAGWHALILCVSPPPLSVPYYQGIDCPTPFSIPSLPYTLNNEITNCYGWDYPPSVSGSCASPYLTGGNDKVYQYNSFGPECLRITLNNTSENAVGFHVYQDCPGAGGNCIGWYGGATSGFLTGDVNLPSAGTYYVIINVSGSASHSWVEYDLDMRSCPVGIEEANLNNTFSINPNPTSGKFTLDNNFPSSQLSITNIIGEKILEQKITSGKTEIDLSSEPKGIYFIKVMQDGKQAVKKIVLM